MKFCVVERKLYICKYNARGYVFPISYKIAGMPNLGLFLIYYYSKENSNFG